jgi:hypothetical protein
LFTLHVTLYSFCFFWQSAKGRPATELFLHPQDAPVVCAYVGRLWKSLVPSPRAQAAPTPAAALPPPPPSSTAGSAASVAAFEAEVDTAAAPASSSEVGKAAGAAGGVVDERTAAVDLPTALRVWVTAGATAHEACGYAGYVPCALRAQLVVAKTTGGQTSLVVLAFRPILPEPAPQPPQPAAEPPAGEGEGSHQPLDEASGGSGSPRGSPRGSPSGSPRGSPSGRPSGTVGCVGTDGLAGPPPASSADAQASLLLSSSRNAHFWQRVSVAAAEDAFQFTAA